MAEDLPNPEFSEPPAWLVKVVEAIVRSTSKWYDPNVYMPFFDQIPTPENPSPTQGDQQNPSEQGAPRSNLSNSPRAQQQIKQLEKTISLEL